PEVLAPPSAVDAHGHGATEAHEAGGTPAAGGPSRPTIAADGTVTLVPAPDLSLVEEGPDGLLPIIGPDGRRPAEVYARPAPPPSGRPRIALVLTGLGLSPTATREVLADAPDAVSLAFSPHAGGLQSWINRARAKGHEVMLHLPLEPHDFPANDPGPNTLLAGAGAPENDARLNWVLSRATGYTGLLAEGGHRFTASEDALAPVLATLERRGLLLVEDGASPRSLTERLARTGGVDAGLADRRIDLRLSRAAIDLMLLDLETIARNRGIAIGLGFAYPITVEQIVAWAPTLRTKGIDLVPVSDVLLTARTAKAPAAHVEAADPSAHVTEPQAH
ncbi:MAG: divergent polysaccharide deacetylase family protein, partial [Alphaproteobacteria bacterium]|nr:divergent polysaccharide deacetylase family protein [Alphaproteobacteria bacterium]